MMTVIIASAVAISFIPLRNIIQSFVDKYFFKGTLESLFLEKQRLEEEVRRTQMLKAVGTLAAGMAHEIKNPLTSIKTFTEYLPERYNDPQFIAKFQNVVVPEIEKINNIVTQLLDFAKPRPLELKEVKIQRLIDETLDLLNNEFIKYRIKVIKDYTVSPVVKVDAAQIKQVFLNAILNSIDAMKEKGGKLKISINRADEYITISIEDNGLGIDKKDLKHVFDPFFSTKKTSTGLGLSIAHGIIEKHNGRIAVESAPGAGTKFTLSLPCFNP